MLEFAQWEATILSDDSAFGNYINRTSARRIGLLKVAADKIHPAGNSALLGAKMALFDLPREHGSFSSFLGKVSHVPLNEHPRFQDVYVENMGFPAPAVTR